MPRCSGVSWNIIINDINAKLIFISYPLYRHHHIYIHMKVIRFNGAIHKTKRHYIIYQGEGDKGGNSELDRRFRDLNDEFSQ